MKRSPWSVWLLALTCSVALFWIVKFTAAATGAGMVTESEPPPPDETQAQLDRARRYNRRLEKIVHRLATRAERHERTIRRERRATRSALHASPFGGSAGVERGLLCIHMHEGSWTDPNAPFWGGLQMDMAFQRAYGGEFLRAFGTADHWPVSVQLAVGIKAYISGRGFGPWPVTARRCGLR